MRAGARPAGEIASCGAGAAGLTPRVDGVQVELRERAGGSVCACRRGGERFLLLGEPRRKTWGAGCAARARFQMHGGVRLGVGNG